MQRQYYKGDKICFWLCQQLNVPYVIHFPFSRALSHLSGNRMSLHHTATQNLPSQESSIRHLNLGLNLNLYYSSWAIFISSLYLIVE